MVAGPDNSGGGTGGETNQEAFSGRLGRDYSSIGKHSCRFEEPDIFFLRIRGEVSAHEVTRMFAEMGAVGRPFYVLADIEGLQGLAPDVRKAASKTAVEDKNGGHLMLGMVVIKATWTMRTVIILLTKAFAYFHPESPSLLAFFETEAEARAWLAAVREKALKK
jgi:SpoIIAA-like